MKHFIPLFIFLFTLIIYFYVGTKGELRPVWALDYFNAMAQSIMERRLDIRIQETYDLVQFHGRFYAPWGILPALILIPLQILKGHFIPTIYMSVVFGALNVVLIYLLLARLKKEFFPQLSLLGIVIITVFFAFGTTNFYVGTLGSVWHVDQIVSVFFGNLGIYFIFKKNRRIVDYILSAVAIAVTLTGRATLSLLSTLPALFFVYDYFPKKKITPTKIFIFIKKGVLLFVPPFLTGTILFFWYNWTRFGNIFEYGYQFIQEAPFLEQLRVTYGIMAIHHLPVNLWHMLFELPSFMYPFEFHINLRGNSILFLSPAFLWLFYAYPKTYYQAFLWVTAIITMIPSLLLYSTGWMQFGYRYSLDITLILVLLTVFGIKGKANIMFFLAVIWSITLQVWGIRIIQ